MSLTLRKRRVSLAMPRTRMARVKSRALRTAERIGPMASTARETAAHRIEDARVWAAPRLDRAAHSVEEDIAPKVSAFLATAAERIDPAPSTRRRGRWSTVALLAGCAACAVGIVLYRNNTRRWADSMKDSAADASRWSAARAGEDAEMSGTRSDDGTPRAY
ncbi:hypothetical protein ABGB17_15615 [Sphaerisporangium sp. B11E5]|uniref:hypothetical protein n=1 Tax=Sphaerisporangium sp. B11E5 TaxID=3153563 RepID=UPI00325CF154